MTDFTYADAVYADDLVMYTNNRLLLLAAMRQACLDVAQGISDGGVRDMTKPTVRAGALAYFAGGGYAEAMEYCGVTVTNGLYPDAVAPWVSAIGTWVRGNGLCPPLYTNEDAILWGYAEGLLDEKEPWEKARKHCAYIKRMAR